MKKAHIQKAIIIIAVVLANAVAFTLKAQTGPKRCHGITTKHVQCKNRAQVNSIYCKVHDTSATRFRCGHLISAGHECKTIVKVAGTLCWRHSAGN